MARKRKKEKGQQKLSRSEKEARWRKILELRLNRTSLFDIASQFDCSLTEAEDLLEQAFVWVRSRFRLNLGEQIALRDQKPFLWVRDPDHALEVMWIEVVEEVESDSCLTIDVTPVTPSESSQGG